MATMATTVHNCKFDRMNDSRFAIRTSVLLVIAALAVLSAKAQATEWKVTPRLSLEESYSDNVTLAPSGQKQSEWVTQITPGISIAGTGARLRVNVDYSLQNLLYANDSSRNNFHHQLSANANATLVENTLFLDAKGNIQQQVTSLLSPASNNNLNPGNVSDVSSYSVSPYLKHKFGDMAVGELRFTHDAVTNGVGTLSDSTADRVDLKLDNGSSFNDLGWGIAYTHEKVNYDLRPDVDSQALTGTASYRVLPKLRAVATLGYEKNNYLFPPGQEPRGSFWSAGLNWTPTTVTSLDASVGEHYFGKTYSFGFNHRTAQTTWIASYSQDITSTRNDILNPDILFAANLNQAFLVHSDGTPLSDREALQEALILAAKKGLPLQVASNQYYLSKQFLGAVAIKHGKNLITLSATHSVRQAQETTAFTSIFSDSLSAPVESTVKQYGLNAQWSITVSTRDTVNLGVGVSRSLFPDLGRTDDQRDIKLGMTRKLEKKLTGSADFRHTLHNSTASQSDYTENVLSGRLMWTF
jgi:uncharacterized protein (PEP-CTERM system associated)